jgi:thiaminase/transcriptional activator TenA
VVLAKAPESARGPILAGLVALGDELAWFDGLASRRDLAPEEPHPSCAAFTDYLLKSAYTEDFPRLAQILYAIEIVYLAAWSALADGPRPPGIHGELIEHWSNPDFTDYVTRLCAVTEAYPAEDDEGFRRVLRFEREFWRMTVGG